MPEEHVHREHHLQSGSQRWVLGWLVFLLLSVVAAYIVRGLLRNVSIYSIATCTLTCVTLCIQCMCTTIEAVASVLI